MRHAALLPIPAGTTFSKWAEDWIEETAELVQSIYDGDNTHALRERNEKLSSYLATLSIIRSKFRAQITKLKREYAKANPPPDKGIKAWEAECEASLGEIGETYDFINDWYDSIAKRVSVTQTHLRSMTAEATGA